MLWAFSPLLPGAAHQQSDPFGVSRGESVSASDSCGATVAVGHNVSATEIIEKPVTGHAYVSGSTNASSWFRFSWATLTGAANSSGAGSYYEGGSNVSATHGYLYGESSFTGAVKKIPFPTDTFFTAGFSLAWYRSGVFCFQDALSVGYQAGGYDAAPLLTYSISKTEMATDTHSGAGNDLAQTGAYAQCVYSTTKGYTMGGYAGVNLTRTQYFIFSTTVTASLAAVLSYARKKIGAVKSSTKGYACGGQGAANSAVIDALTFSTEAIAAISATLYEASYGVAGAEYGSDGYLFGGAPPNIAPGRIAKLGLSTETYSVESATMDMITAYYACMSTESYLAPLGTSQNGALSPPAPCAESFSLSAAQDIGSLGFGRLHYEAVAGESGYGFIGNVFSGPSYQMRRINYSTEVASYVTALADGPGRGASLSSTSVGYLIDFSGASASMYGYQFSSLTYRTVMTLTASETYSRNCGASGPFAGYVLAGGDPLIAYTRKLDFDTETYSQLGVGATGMRLSAGGFSLATDAAWRFGGRNSSDSPQQYVAKMYAATETWASSPNLSATWADGWVISAGSNGGNSYGGKMYLLAGYNTEANRILSFAPSTETYGTVTTTLSDWYNAPAGIQSGVNGYMAGATSAGTTVRIAFSTDALTNLADVFPSGYPNCAFSSSGSVAHAQTGTPVSFGGGTQAETFSASSTHSATTGYGVASAESYSVVHDQDSLRGVNSARIESFGPYEIQSAIFTAAATASETVSGGDSSSVIATFVGSVAEAVAAADTDSVVRVVVGATTEAATANETQSPVAVFAASYAESMASVDSEDSEIDNTVSAIESAGASSQQDSARTMPAIEAETATAGDSQQVLLVALTVAQESFSTTTAQSGGASTSHSAEEAFAPGDAHSAQLQAVAGQVEPFTASHGQQSTMVAPVSVSEASALSSVQDRTSAQPAVFADAASAGSVQGATVSLVVIGADAASMSEQVAVIATMFNSTGEAFTLSDVQSYGSGSSVPADRTEPSSISEAIAGVVSFVAANTGAVSAGDAAEVSYATGSSVGESAAPSHSSTAALERPAQSADSLTPVEAASAIYGGASVSVSEPAALSDAQGGGWASLSAVSEATTPASTQQAARDLFGVSGETANAQTNQSILAGVAAFADESAEVFGTQSATFFAQSAVSDGVVVIDAQATTVAHVSSLIESMTLADTIVLIVSGALPKIPAAYVLTKQSVVYINERRVTIAVLTRRERVDVKTVQETSATMTRSMIASAETSVSDVVVVKPDDSRVTIKPTK